MTASSLTKNSPEGLYLQSGTRPVHCQWGRELRAPKVCHGICLGCAYTSELSRSADHRTSITMRFYPISAEKAEKIIRIPYLNIVNFIKKTIFAAPNKKRLRKENGAIAQLVEQRTENPCVPGSIPGGTTIKCSVRITVSTQDSQSCNRGSIPLPSTKVL